MTCNIEYDIIRLDPTGKLNGLSFRISKNQSTTLYSSFNGKTYPKAITYLGMLTRFNIGFHPALKATLTILASIKHNVQGSLFMLCAVSI
jgi:hypothetical protein